MIQRYENKQIAQICSEQNKLQLWQETELAVLKAQARLKQNPLGVYETIQHCLAEHPIDISWMIQREQELKHDLNAFLEERQRFIPTELQQYFHQGLTSYDTEEPAFVRTLKLCIIAVAAKFSSLENALVRLAERYRYTPMNARTHGQEAEVQSFGKRCLTWLTDLRICRQRLKQSAEILTYSKLSGAVGNYNTIDPDLEAEALAVLGFEPYYGATQIMPRVLYTPIAAALCELVMHIHKIALDIRLGARSGCPIYQEPFGTKQKGSSAMPHKKNTINCEKIEGMARLAQSYHLAIQQNIVTWEERSIEQSSVERVAWADLFHVTAHALNTLDKVISGLQVYPDNMLREIVASRGCYAANHAKEFLKIHGAAVGLSSEEAYRIVQLAAFNAFEPSPEDLNLRDNPPRSLAESNANFHEFQSRFWSRFYHEDQKRNIQFIIPLGKLRVSDQLDADDATVDRWNQTLRSLFRDPQNNLLDAWSMLFEPSFSLRNEHVLFERILGE